MRGLRNGWVNTSAFLRRGPRNLRSVQEGTHEPDPDVLRLGCVSLQMHPQGEVWSEYRAGLPAVPGWRSMHRRRARQNAIRWAVPVLATDRGPWPELWISRGRSGRGFSRLGRSLNSISKPFGIIIDRSDDPISPDIKGQRSLSLEEAVQLSLEENLGLQVSLQSAEIAEAGLAASKAKFHPLLEVSGGAAGTKRGYPRLRSPIPVHRG